MNAQSIIEPESSCGCDELRMEIDGATIKLPRIAGHSCSYVRTRNKLIPLAWNDAEIEMERRGEVATDIAYGGKITGAFSRAMDARAAAERKEGRL